MTIQVERTAETILHTAQRFSDAAASLEALSKLMIEKGDLTYASEAINICVNVFSNSRLDLLVTRPLRAMQAALDDAESK